MRGFCFENTRLLKEEICLLRMENFTQQTNVNPWESTPILVNMFESPSFAGEMSGGLVLEASEI